MMVVIFLANVVAAVAVAVTPDSVNASVGFLQQGNGLKQDLMYQDDPPGLFSPQDVHKNVHKHHKHVAPWIQYTFCIIWVVMITALPSVVPLVNRKMPTRSQMIVGATMLVVFLGGLWLFTNIILFQSIHFKTIRPLTLVECMYFMSQVITTVGYGDITPAKVRGQVFVGLYVLGAMFIISMVVSDVVNQLIESADRYKQHHLELKLQQEALEGGEVHEEGHSPVPKKGPKKMNVRKGQKPKSVRAAQIGPIDQMLCLTPPQRPPVTALVASLAVFGILDLMWIMFFSLHPDEGKTVFQAIYMSVITLSSVGFGWFTPVTEEGMIFASFLMLFGCFALVNVITQFTELMMKLNEYEKLMKEPGKNEAHKHFDQHEEIHKEGEGSQDASRCTEVQFLEFCVLQMKCVQVEHLERIEEAFHKLQPDADGKVDVSAIQKELIGVTGLTPRVDPEA